MRTSYIGVKVVWRRVDGMKVELVQRIPDRLRLAVRIGNGDHGRAEGTREGRGARRRSHGEIPVRKTKALGRGHVAVPDGRRELGRDGLSSGV